MYPIEDDMNDPDRSDSDGVLADLASDRLFDVMLAEALDDVAPRDFSANIFESLKAQPAVEAPPVQLSIEAKKHHRSNSRHWISLAVAASLMAGFVGYYWSMDRKIGDQQQAEAEAQPVVEPKPESSDGTPKTKPLQKPKPIKPRTAPRDFDLAEVPFGQDRSTQSQAPGGGFHIATRPEKLDNDVIVAKLNEHLASAWKRLGIQPQPEVPADQVASRIATVMGLSSSQIPTNADLAKSIGSDNSRHLQTRWAAHLIGENRWSRIDNENRTLLVSALQPAFDGSGAYNDVVSELLKDLANPNSVLASAFDKSDSVSLTNQVCDVLLDIDGSCGRCHSHPLEANIAQQDYWNLNAILRSSDKAMFFESPDGRQIAAYPNLSNRLLRNSHEAQSIDDLDLLAKEISTSKSLADATVNGLWKLVFGKRLVGRTSDPLAAPADRAFRDAKNLLSQQLIAHDFNLGQATSWILRSRPMQLSSGLSSLDSKSLLVAKEQLDAFHTQARAFASFQPSTPQVGFGELIALAEDINASGAGISVLANQTILGQSTDSNKKPNATSKVAERTKNITRSFHEIDKTSLPAGWLASLENRGFDEQARHLFYVAGHSSPSDKQLENAKRIRESVGNNAAALTQLWWAIKLSKGKL